MKNAPFSRSALLLLFACATSLFALSVLLRAYDATPASSGDKTAPNSYSVSAIGHAGFYDLLRRMDVPVSRSLGNALAMTGRHGTLIAVEPERWRMTSDDSLKLGKAPRLLLVLPKWRGVRDDRRPAWISAAKLVSPELARQTLALVSGRSDVMRKAWPETWPTNSLGTSPSGSGEVQLVRSGELRPVVGDADGMLVGELTGKDGRIVWVLSDPDVLSNHGLVKGGNAVFMLALVDELRKRNNEERGAPVVFDETVHGFREAQGTPLTLLFRFPFVIVTALLCATGGLLTLAGSTRFGAPALPRPHLDFGKEQLIGNSARLLDYAGHHDAVLKRYIRMTIRAAARGLHAPSDLNEPALAAWLDRIGKARGVKDSCAAILHSASNLNTGDSRDRLFALAGAIHRWKGDILHGTARHRRSR